MDFSRLGLTSLGAVQLIARSCELFGIELPFMVLFQPETSNVAGLVKYIELLRWCDAGHVAGKPSSEESGEIVL